MSEILPSEEERIEKAVKILSRDGLVAYPTETVYGLGADALSDVAVRKVYEAKKRLLGKPVSIAVCDTEMIYAVADVSEFAERFIDKFLPGPITVVLPVKNILPGDLSGGTGYIGIRYPDHFLATKLIAAFDSPITSTSANISGNISPVTAAQVDVACDYVIDGGKLPGTPSTVINLDTKRIERAGAMIDEIANFVKTHS